SGSAEANYRELVTQHHTIPLGKNLPIATRHPRRRASGARQRRVVTLRALTRPGPSFPVPPGPRYTCEYGSGRSTMLVMLETVGGSSLKRGSAESFFQSGSAPNLSQAVSSDAISGKLSM